MKFTESQQKVIDLRNKNILVSAAAGSGKTAVLVERIIGLITDRESPVDIDRLLIVTFTNAAAAQMKERIQSALEKKLEEEPENENLLRQVTLLHHAQITTIDSFCLFLVKNHFHEIGLDPGFRVADPGEIQLLKQDCLGEIMEELLENETTTEEFQHLLETIAFRGRERVLEEMVLKLHSYSESFPWPREWLKQRLQDYSIEKKPEETEWGKEIQNLYDSRLQQMMDTLSMARDLCSQEDGPYMYLETLLADEEILMGLKKAGWKEACETKPEIRFRRISSKKDPVVSEEKKEVVKNLRDQVKKEAGKLQEDFLRYSYGQILEQMEEISKVEKTLLHTVVCFGNRFQEKKRERNLLDFSDMEHFALEILTIRTPEEEAGFLPTKTALDYQQFYQEIMIDEYQDSNLVQEILLQSLSGNQKNRFMVGDLKQSIYKFRLARPEIFLEKYHTYGQGEEGSERIDLHQNFRSRKEVIESINDVFYQIMGADLGKIDYTKKEALFASASYPDIKEDYKTCLMLVEEGKEEVKEQEAAMVAERIRKMVGTFLVTDEKTGEPRPLKYSDIVILLRTNTGWDEIFYQIFMEQGIPSAITNKTGYFNAPEVQTLLGFLQALDNPLQEIPLYGVLISSFGGFCQEEIVSLKLEKKNSLYENLKSMTQYKEGEGEKRRDLRKKTTDFLQRFKEYRNLVYLIPIHQLLRRYLQETGYLYYCLALPGGEQRAANIKMLLEKAETYEKTSFFGLFHFIRYMEQLQKYRIDTPEAAVMDEEGDVVRIMSIHKSKGLEFPVCFLCGLSKKINQQDAKETMICDMDLGIGMDYRNPQKRIKKTDLRKNVVAEKIRRENLGEELRILYVAMTRAKEKLIMTATIKDYEKQLLGLTYLKSYKGQRLPLSYLLQGESYLDFLLPSFLRKGDHVQITVENPFKNHQEQMGEIVNNLLDRKRMEQEMESLAKEPGQQNMTEQMKELLQVKYKYENLKGLYVKTTVSELKMKAMEEKDEEAFHLFEETPKEVYVPRFVEEKEEISGTRRGNAYHRVMELMDFSPLPSLEQLWDQLEQMEESGILDPEYLSLVKKEKLQAFLQSPLAKRMERAQSQGRLYREQPFVLGIDADRLDVKFPKGEKVLIQGIIDVFFEEEGELVVLDYKTDRVSSKEELKKRYEEQLNYYADALSKLTGKRVKEKLIYSFALNQVIS